MIDDEMEDLMSLPQLLAIVLAVLVLSALYWLTGKLSRLLAQPRRSEMDWRE